MALLRIEDVLKETGHRSPASIYNAARDGLFTNPVKIGERSSAWPDHEVKAIIGYWIAGKDDESIRALVARLHAKRELFVQA